MKRVIILGATGSIGAATIKACQQNSQFLKIIAISYFRNYKKAVEIALKLGIQQLIGPRPATQNCKFVIYENYQKALQKLKPDLVVNGVKGFAGLEYTLTTIQEKVDIAIANKESLIVGYPLIAKELQDGDCHLIPLDSEHFSIYIACQREPKYIKKVWITASGGSFFNGKCLDFNVANARKIAFKHPTWKMGPEITINSATLMNKAFEIIEAMNLFALRFDQIDVLWHKKSQIHGAVALRNGVVVIIGFKPEMSIPINAALTYPNINQYCCSMPDFSKSLNWAVIPMNKKKLAAFRIAELASKSQKMAIVMVSANEFFVRQFISGVIAIKDILPQIELVMKHYMSTAEPELHSFNTIENFFNNVHDFCEESTKIR